MVAEDKRRRSIDLILRQLTALPWPAGAADIYSDIKSQNEHQGTPKGDLGTQIAAHALAETLPLVTHNTRYFEKIAGLQLANRMAPSLQ